MSLKRVIHRASAFLALLAFLFLRLASVNGAVACFGADGHVALEVAHAATSETLDPKLLARQAALTVSIASEHYLSDQRHGLPCIDVSVDHTGEQYAISSPAPTSQAQSAAVLVPAYVGLKPLVTKTATVFARAPPVGNISLRSLRTVVLLI